ncbi:hypothetical protein [Nesterenkonia alba]|uniref:hypothetical protein n=1 Tax=Nesterenkonia alba TaxID=515814 RepID=UPI0003B34DF3|nr:hypothetical protein [Nesterenkonia alba]
MSRTTDRPSVPRVQPRRPGTMKAAAFLIAAAGVTIIVSGALFGLAAPDPAELGPFIRAVGRLGIAALVGVPLLLVAARGTSGSRRWRVAATAMIALTPALLLLHPALVLTVLPALVGLVLLWVPASNAFVRATQEPQSRLDMGRIVKDDTFQSRIPFSNLGQGVHQPPGL